MILGSGKGNKIVMSNIETFEDKDWIPRGSSQFLGYVGPLLKESLDEVELKRFLEGRGVSRRSLEKVLKVTKR